MTISKGDILGKIHKHKLTMIEKEAINPQNAPTWDLILGESQHVFEVVEYQYFPPEGDGKQKISVMLKVIG